MAAKTDLHDYLATTARQLKTDLETIDGHIRRSVKFLVTLGERIADDTWLPQQVSTDKKPDDWIGSNDKTVSTHLMVSHALYTISNSGYDKQLVLLPHINHRLRGIEEKEWSEFQKRGAELAKRLGTQALNTIIDDKSLNSKTFGNNSPLATCWLLEVHRLLTFTTPATPVAPTSPQFNDTHDLFKDRRNPKDDFYHADNSSHNAGTQGVTTAPLNSPQVDRTRALYALRRLQEEVLLRNPPQWIPEYADYFLSKLHDHLSFYRIPDSRFDPAELAFNLEGALLCEKNTGPKVERATIETAIDVLCDCRVHTYNWRPVRPIVRQPNGLVLFPVNVEVANSLLRSLSYCSRELQPHTQAAAIAALRGYMGWLDTRAVRCDDDLEGWHSEHINNERIIHSWETSQVLVFLVHLRKLLHATLASELVRLSAIAERKPGNPATVNHPPHVSLCPTLNYQDRIRSLFVTSRKSKQQLHNYGLLLYGPPGTGKTYAAQQLAKELGYRLLSISVSDFLASGGIDIERQAKAVFEVITEQHDTVVLFDEIDHLLLDRSHYLYSKMDTVFQFLTPGMLTKLQNLRDSKSVLFVINTNYEHRIDSAIKRAGRIDHGILVLPPDLQGRKHIIQTAWDSSKNNGTSGAATIMPPGELETLAKQSAFLSYTQLHTIAASAQSFDECLRELQAAPRSWRFSNYETVLEGAHHFFPHDFTLAELMGVLAIELESTDISIEEFYKAHLLDAEGKDKKPTTLFKKMTEQFRRQGELFSSVGLQQQFKAIADLMVADK